MRKLQTTDLPQFQAVSELNPQQKQKFQEVSVPKVVGFYLTATYGAILSRFGLIHRHIWRYESRQPSLGQNLQELVIDIIEYLFYNQIIETHFHK